MRTAFLTLLLLSTSAFCKTPDAPACEDWMHAGWKLIRNVAGDLNRDGKRDAVLVLDENNKANLKPNENLGAPVLNLNPRRLLILFQTTSGYRHGYLGVYAQHRRALRVQQQLSDRQTTNQHGAQRV